MTRHYGRKIFFEEQMGGYVVVDVERAKNASKDAPKNERAKYKKELAMTKVFARNGYRMVMLREIPGISSPDVTIDGILAELKEVKSANNIVRYAKKATRKQGAEIVLFHFNMMTSDILGKIKYLTKIGIHGKYYVSGENYVVNF